MYMDRRALERFGTELIVLATASVAASAVFGLWLYPLLDIPGAAPMPGRTLLVALLTWVLITRRGETFRDFGLGRPAWIWMTILLALAFLAAKLFVVQPLADVVIQALEMPAANRTVFDHVRGNSRALVAWLGAAWIVGGLAEEFIFRGYLMKRVAESLEGRAAGWAVAVIVQAALFGAMHAYLGRAGVVSATFAAMFYGLCFLLAKRSLWPVVLVHGAWDSLGFILLYLRGVPST